jgi:C-terminal processing protease CtpA/Prc
VIHVTEVFKGSPANTAGFVSESDFILGTRQIIFRSVDDFVKLVQVNVNTKIELFVYNLGSWKVRVVNLVP